MEYKSRAHNASRGPFSVNHWGSHPDAGNDDCFTGSDHETLEEALTEYWKDPEDSSVEYVEIDGLEEHELLTHGIQRIRKNPNFIRRSHSQDDGEWKREMAMQAGMAGGCEAYNEAMGWDTSDPNDY